MTIQTQLAEAIHSEGIALQLLEDAYLPCAKAKKAYNQAAHRKSKLAEGLAWFRDHPEESTAAYIADTVLILTDLQHQVATLQIVKEREAQRVKNLKDSHDQLSHRANELKAKEAKQNV